MTRIEIDGLENYGLVRDTYFRAKELLGDPGRNHDELVELYPMLSSGNSTSIDLLMREIGEEEYVGVLRGAKYGRYNNVKLVDTGEFFVIEPLVIEGRFYRISWSKDSRNFETYHGWKENVRLAKDSFFLHADLEHYFETLKVLYAARNETISETGVYIDIKKMFQQDFSPRTVIALNNALTLSNNSSNYYHAFASSGRLVETEPFLLGVHPICEDFVWEFIHSRDHDVRKQIFEWLIGHDLTIRMDNELYASEDRSRLVCLGDTSKDTEKADISLKEIDYVGKSRKILLTQVDV